MPIPYQANCHDESLKMRSGRPDKIARIVQPPGRGRTARQMGLLHASLALSLLLATAAHAGVAHEPPAVATEGSAPRSDESEQQALQSEIGRFKAASISLREALSIAQDRQAGSRAVDASFDGETGAPTYQVRMVKGNRLWETTIDALTGNTIKTAVVSSVDDLEEHDRDLLVRLRNVRPELLDGIAVAERATNGKAISAGLMVEKGRLQFVIVCVAGSDLKQVLLEPPAAAAGVKK
ncbi:PepSY domain-containing protein [Bradyrhizobium sp. USDA 4353]